MLRPRTLLSALALAALTTTTACFHAVVETGRAPSATVVQKPWVNTFVFGLVAAPEIDVTAQCPRGVAKVETQQTFVNGLVGLLTLGIYTPQSATITCAAGAGVAVTPELRPEGRPVITVADDATQAQRSAAFAEAARESARTGQPVFVRF